LINTASPDIPQLTPEPLINAVYAALLVSLWLSFGRKTPQQPNRSEPILKHLTSIPQRS
jgi:hypothetical protein